MKIKHEYKNVLSSDIWNIVATYINENGQIMSITGIVYKAQASTESISYIGGQVGCARAMKGESISKDLFVSAFEQTRMLEYINTKTVKQLIGRKQSPFVGLLKSAGIIE